MVEMDAVPTWVGDFAAIPVIAFFMWYFSKKIAEGSWVPRSHVDLLIEANDKVVEAKDKTIASQERQLQAFQDVTETTEKVLLSLQEAASISQTTGGDGDGGT